MAVKKITQADEWQMTQFIKVRCLASMALHGHVHVCALCLCAYVDLSSSHKVDIQPAVSVYPPCEDITCNHIIVLGFQSHAHLSLLPTSACLVACLSALGSHRDNKCVTEFELCWTVACCNLRWGFVNKIRKLRCTVHTFCPVLTALTNLGPTVVSHVM